MPAIHAVPQEEEDVAVVSIELGLEVDDCSVVKLAADVDVEAAAAME